MQVFFDVRLGRGITASLIRQDVDHYFNVEDLNTDDPIRVSAGGAVKLHWNMEWRDFEPKLWFYLRAKKDDPKAKLPCDLTPFKGYMPDRSQWIGLKVADDCPTIRVPVVIYVRTSDSPEPLLERDLLLDIRANPSVLGVKGELSPPLGEPSSNRRGWLLVNNYTMDSSVTISSEKQMDRGRFKARCRTTPPMPPQKMTETFIDAVYSNCLGGFSNALSGFIVPRPKPKPKGQKEAPPPPPERKPDKYQCRSEYGGNAEKDSTGYGPSTGHLVVDFNFMKEEEVIDDYLVGCRFVEQLKGKYLKTPRKIGKKRYLPMPRDIKKYDRLSFMARSRTGSDIWMETSMTYWTHLEDQPKESQVKDVKLSGEWRRFEVDLDTQLYVEPVNRKRAIDIRFDVYRKKLSCDGRPLENPTQGSVEIANVFFIKEGVDVWAPEPEPEPEPEAEEETVGNKKQGDDSEDAKKSPEESPDDTKK